MPRKNPVSAGPYMLASSTFEQNSGELEITFAQILRLATSNRMKSVSEGYEMSDSFVTDSILRCIKLSEGMSAYTKNFNITGLAMLLN